MRKKGVIVKWKYGILHIFKNSYEPPNMFNVSLREYKMHCFFSTSN